uniref:Putative secreted peptide n=1 Tax=Anopheles braziliensis TaxID=58242 RepID=A0A2M3ZXH9_9DIPT
MSCGCCFALLLHHVKRARSWKSILIKRRLYTNLLDGRAFFGGGELIDESEIIIKLSLTYTHYRLPSLSSLAGPRLLSIK